MLKSSRQHVDAELQISTTRDLLMQSLFEVFANTAGLDSVTLNTEDGSTGAGFGVRCDLKTGALIWYKETLDGEAHSVDGPAIYNQILEGDAVIGKVEKWRRHGRPYQEKDQPSIIETLNVGIVKHIWESPREDQGLPHEVVFKPNGRMYSQKWFNPEGEISRDDDLPAQILYYNNDSQLPYKKSWFRNGERYRFNGPAVITFDEKGNTLDESHFFIDGILSRTAKEI